MPWASRTIVGARREFVALAQSSNANVRELCRRFNISPKTAYKFLNRFREMGEDGLQDFSRRPLHCPSTVPENMKEAVLAVREAHPWWGGRRIAKELKTQGMPKVPAASTITTILSGHGLPHSDRKPRCEPMHRKSVLPFSIQESDAKVLRKYLLSKLVLERRRAFVILASSGGVRPTTIYKQLNLSPITYRRCVRVFAEGGVEALFARRKNPHRKYDNQAIKDAVFATLHQPPSNFGINRTTWKMADLSAVLSRNRHPVGEDVVRKIIMDAGYRWRKARIVLTSADPEFSEKLAKINSILTGLRSDEAFFSIDEFGPFAIKDQQGRSLVAPGEQRLVHQWQQSRGSIILTAALELSSNQVTHFYSSNKNTAEMIRMMNLLIDRYPDRRQIYLSWDAASWHVSKELSKRIEEHNASGIDPHVAVAPLPARAQFLNVIESVFSGMARAIIHNSNYKSRDDAVLAIDRYFEERNRHFKEHPRRAGKRIWGKERVPPSFSESNNCKDPRLG
jgi:transposase